MSTTPLPLRSVGCPRCGELLGVRAVDVGKRGKCRKCGAVFFIEGEGAAPVAGAAKTQAGGAKPPATADLRQAAGTAAAVIAAPKAEPAPPPQPTTVTFPCDLCETRLTARLADVGKRMKCPDCGRVNVIPPPAAVAAAKTPAAMGGAQYGLWGVDEGPNTPGSTAQSPRLHPVECGLCQTLMYATDAQVGKKMKCPDCGTLTVAKARAPVKPRGPVIVPDGDEYQLDEASAPGPRPVYAPIGRRDVEERREANVAGGAPATRSVAAKGEQDEGDRGDRRALGTRLGLGDGERRGAPKLPAVPLVQGALRMLFTADVLARWVALSLALTGAGWLLSWVLSAMGSQVFMAIPMFAVGCVFAGLWLLSALPLMLAIVTESSEGNDRLHDPPNPMGFDFGEAFFVALAGVVSTLPAWLAVKAASALPGEAQGAIAVAAWLVCFPIVLLSNLEQSSAFAIFSPRLGASLVRCAGPWLLFYIETAVLFAAALGTLFAISLGPTWVAYFGPWVTVGTMLVYVRLIGRLAWWLAETMPAAEEETAD